MNCLTKPTPASHPTDDQNLVSSLHAPRRIAHMFHEMPPTRKVSKFGRPRLLDHKYVAEGHSQVTNQCYPVRLDIAHFHTNIWLNAQRWVKVSLGLAGAHEAETAAHRG